MNILGKIKKIFEPKPDPVYCEECGKELVLQHKDVKFDPYTGNARRVLVTLKCPDFDDSGSLLYDGETIFSYHYCKEWYEDITNPETQE